MKTDGGERLIASPDRRAPAQTRSALEEPEPLRVFSDAPAPLLDAEDLERIRSRGRIIGLLPLLGPAFVASIAYVDPGNFATNLEGGRRFGEQLLWVLVAANLMAALVQYLSAKLGIVTGRSLPQLCRQRFPRPVAVGLWLQAEIVAMATDLAEFVGAAIAFKLLFALPLFLAGALTAAGSFGILLAQTRGHRRFEALIMGLLAIILLGFAYETLEVGAPGRAVARGLIPGFSGSGSVLVAVGMLGATVMPHVVYLHSALTQDRVAANTDRQKRLLLGVNRLDVAVAMGLAGLANIAMLILFAQLFHHTGVPAASLIQAHAGLIRVIGGTAGLAFAVALLSSGLSSSTVGTYSGQIVLQGFMNWNLSLFARRFITMTPSLIVLAVGFSPTRILLISQVVLSFGIPFALIPLVIFTSRASVMGRFANSRAMSLLAGSIVVLISALNVFLLVELIA